MDLYAPWYPGVIGDVDVADILTRAGFTGIEMGNVDNSVEALKRSGLKFSCFGPGFDRTLNLVSTDTVAAFDDPRILEVAKMSDTGVTLRLGYSGKEVVKMMAYPNLIRGDGIISDRGVLLGQIVNNLVAIQQRVGLMVRVETLDYSRPGQEIDWTRQRDEAQGMRSELEAVVAKFGINAALQFVTDPDFVRDVLNATSMNIGFCFCIPHVYISGDSKTHSGEYKGTVEDYFQEMLGAAGGRIHEMHVSVPGGNKQTGYADHKLPLDNSTLSEEILELVQLVVSSAPELQVVVLETAPPKGKTPREYASHMANQATIFRGAMS